MRRPEKRVIIREKTGGDILERSLMQELVEWKTSEGRKPLIIRGARQVGKTWLMKEFGRRYFKNFAYVNFDNNERMAALFEGNLDINRLLLAINAETGVKIEANETLIIFDEVQEVPRALGSLKYFCENAPQYAVIAAGSLLGIALHQGTSFPVGKVDFLDLYPLSFSEFLSALGEDALAEILHNKDYQLITSFHEKYIERMKEYFFVGGMPEAVVTFITKKDFVQVRKVQLNLLAYYAQDFFKHAPLREVPRINMVWNSIGMQLAKENKKFFYGQIKKGARASEFEIAIQWLKDCGLVHTVNRVSKPAYPLKAYIDFGAFKMFMFDIGLLCAQNEIDVQTILEGNKLFIEFKGAMSEQFVLQELIASGKHPFYYATETARGEIDFMLQSHADVVPIEVKAGENVKQMQSLKAYNEKYQPRLAVRISALPYRQEDWLVNLPLYMTAAIGDF